MLCNLTIIYNTCDKYSCLWDGYFYLFQKYWPQCRNTIVLNTEKKSFSFEGLDIVRPRASDCNESWSQRLLNSLDVVKTPYVLLTLDDFYLKAPVDTDTLEKCIIKMEEDNSIQTYTFAWQPGPNSKSSREEKFEARGRFAPYRINAQIALWRVSYLRKIIRTYETPWQFELSGSFRSSVFGGKLYSLKRGVEPVFDYDFGFLIIRGMVNIKIAEYFKSIEGLSMDFPFPEYHKEQTGNKNNRFKRVIKYGYDAITSLFRV